MTDIILVAVCVLLVWLLNRSYKKDPFAYVNIILVSAILMTVAIIMGRGVLAVTVGDGSSRPVLDAVDFVWSFSRVLFIPICFLMFFVCISNVVLLRKEGFRKNNFLGLIFTLTYLVVINAAWRPLNQMPQIENALFVFLRMLLCYTECTVLAICIMGYGVLKADPAYDRDFAIILGCSISRKGKIRPLLKARVNRAIKFAWDQEIHTGKPVRYVPSGGQGSDEPLSEGSAMELYLLSHSAEDYEVFPEKKSRNTMENLLFSKEIIDREKEEAKVTVVTTNYHVLRSGMLARRAGLKNATLTGSGTKWYFWPNAFLREMVAIFVMFYKVHIGAAAVCAIAAAAAVYVRLR